MRVFDVVFSVALIIMMFILTGTFSLIDRQNKVISTLAQDNLHVAEAFVALRLNHVDAVYHAKEYIIKEFDWRFEEIKAQMYENDAALYQNNLNWRERLDKLENQIGRSY